MQVIDYFQFIINNLIRNQQNLAIDSQVTINVFIFS